MSTPCIANVDYCFFSSSVFQLSEQFFQNGSALAFQSLDEFLKFPFEGHHRQEDPPLIGCDLRNMIVDTLEILSNKEVIAVKQGVCLKLELENSYESVEDSQHHSQNHSSRVEVRGGGRLPPGGSPGAERPTPRLVEVVGRGNQEELPVGER
ncbi:hypothetical protein KSP40_PGU014355 [Platanthera guangdongensis]|uniref:Uncharacterized protein n=1 Tax=Platanthera guangdongensis TaxID=2320717 RepID=A0ABR2M7W3_9ASPA